MTQLSFVLIVIMASWGGNTAPAPMTITMHTFSSQRTCVAARDHIRRTVREERMSAECMPQ